MECQNEDFSNFECLRVLFVQYPSSLSSYDASLLVPVRLPLTSPRAGDRRLVRIMSTIVSAGTHGDPGAWSNVRHFVAAGRRVRPRERSEAAHE